MVAQWLYGIGALPFVLLGALHLLYTIKDHKNPRMLAPRSEDLLTKLKAEPLGLTSQTTMWRAWLGFNISHSAGAIFIGLIYLYFAAVEYEVFLQLKPIMAAAPLIAGAYMWMAKTYWFSKPFQGLVVSAVCFTAGFILA